VLRIVGSGKFKKSFFYPFPYLIVNPPPVGHYITYAHKIFIVIVTLNAEMILFIFFLIHIMT
jgi:hypothetical protein